MDDQVKNQSPSRHLAKTDKSLLRKRSNEIASRLRRSVGTFQIDTLESRCLLSADVTEFSSPVTGLGIKGITLAADGNLYFAEPGTGANPGRIGELDTTTGVFFQFAIPVAANKPQWITSGSDGNIWFTESPGNAVARMVISGPNRGVVTEFPIPTAASNPQQIIGASDGNLWFTEFNANKIARMTTTGTFTEFSTLFASPPPDNPYGLVDRGDGNIWYVANGSSRVGFQGINSGTAGETSIPTANSGPFGIAEADDNNLYYTEANVDKIGRITNLFTPQSEISLPAGSVPESIVTAPDGYLYFTENGTGDVAQLDPATFSVTNRYLPGANTGPTGIVIGPDGNPWITENGQDRIGRVNVHPDYVNFTAGISPNPQQGQEYSGQVASFSSTIATSTAADFKANIDWGDGTVTTGTIVQGAGGEFFVDGTHTYADAAGSPYTLKVSLSRAAGDYLQSRSASVTVVGPAAPTLSIGDVLKAEGNSGTTTFSFNVTRSGDLSGTSSVVYSTSDDTATTADGDYQVASNTVTFGPGEASKTIDVLVNGDTKLEADETFFVDLSSPTGATIDDGHAVGTIVNDDAPPPPPTLSINNVSLTEGNSGLKNFTFTVTRSGNKSGTSTVHYATASGTASSSTDFVSKSGTVTFNPGDTTHTITIQVKGDTINEADETFKVNLSSAVGATITKATGTGTIINDDSTLPKVSIGGFSATEGDSGLKTFTFKVTLNKASGQTVTVNYTTVDSSAHAGSDYVAKSGTLTFAAGETSKTITVSVKGDHTHEADENFFVQLSSPVHATLGVSKATGTIKNDD